MRSITKYFSAGVFFVGVGSAVALLGAALPYSSASPFTFDAPVRTAVAVAVQKESVRAGSARVVNADGEVVMLDDWNYTGGPGHISPAK